MLFLICRSEDINRRNDSFLRESFSIKTSAFRRKVSRGRTNGRVARNKVRPWFSWCWMKDFNELFVGWIEARRLVLRVFSLFMNRFISSTTYSLLTNHRQIYKVPDWRCRGDLAFINAFRKKCERNELAEWNRSATGTLTWIFTLSIAYPERPLFRVRRVHRFESLVARVRISSDR